MQHNGLPEGHFLIFFLSTFQNMWMIYEMAGFFAFFEKELWFLLKTQAKTRDSRLALLDSPLRN